MQTLIAYWFPAMLALDILFIMAICWAAKE